ncbi:MAG: S8 family serine peptidase [Lysobacterales bacterium]
MTLASAIGLALAGAGFANPVDLQAAQSGVQTAAPDNAAIRTYIITFVEDGLLNYGGGVNGMLATMPQAGGSRELDTGSSAARAYGDYLTAQREIHLNAIQNTLGRALAPSHSYSITLNGVAVELSASEAARVAALPGVTSVRAAKTEHLTLYHSPTFIGANTIWDGTATPTQTPNRGNRIKIGDLDGGTNSTNPMFANDPLCGFGPSTPKLIAKDCSTSSGGLCNGPNPEANPGFGHGVHTSSTVAGDTIDNTVNPAPSLPNGVTMSGVAPCAQIYHYKVCQTNSCAGADILAGIENAIADQVKVLNFSISGGTSPWNDNDRNFLDAVNANVFVAAAAGNLQTGETDPTGKVNHLGPWVMTVAASTQDEFLGPQLAVTGPGTPPADITGIALNPGSTTVPANTTDMSGQQLRSYAANVPACTASGGIPAGTFAGSIAVLQRGTCSFTEKITNATNAGAIMVIIANNVVGTINMDTTGAPATPAFSIDMGPGNDLIAFINTNPTSALGNYRKLAASSIQGDVLASFSYKGPTPSPLADLTKPDIAAPGVNIYAAVDPQSGNYAFMSGTSMATPHITGAAALVRSVHPAWTVQETKSALQMTATNANGVAVDGVTPWVVDDVGSGRVDLTQAALAGLTMDETYAHFLAANPSGGSINVKALNVPELRNTVCTGNCTWTRTVKNQLATTGTWNVTSTTATNFAVTASPASFTLAPGATQAITFTATPNASITAMSFGKVILTEAANQAPVQHITVAIKGTAVVNAPPVADFTDTINGLTVSFTDTSSDSDGTIASRSWDFGDGSALDTTANPVHTYAAGGTYSVSLTVTDNGGASNTKTLPVTVVDDTILRDGFDGAGPVVGKASDPMKPRR